MAIRERHKQPFKERHGVGLGLTSFFVRAAIGALREFPRINAEIQGDEMVLKHYYDIGIAVGASEGLVVPVLRDADRLSFAQIEQKVRAFAKSAEEAPSPLPTAASSDRSSVPRSSIRRRSAFSGCTRSRTARWRWTGRSRSAR
jgi:pyruvate/2-oxoglutarate dehydrogenase complex dihydrolipoamide acyltransferase (E2) component